MSEDQRFFEDVCACFDLGTVMAEPVVIDGGLSNRLYRVVTDRGEFAVKRMIANAGSAAFKSNVEASFVVERLALAAGIAMPVPVPVLGSTEALGGIMDGGEACWVRVHQWIEASKVTASDIDPGMVAQLGVILATLHRLPCSDPELSSPQEPPAMDRAWQMALSSHRNAASLLDAIETLEDIVRRGYQAPRPVPVLSHRDLDAKNLLRDEYGNLVVIDWDAAGPTDAQWDAVIVAMDWSGIKEGAVSRQRFDTFLHAYVVAGGNLDPITPLSFAGWAEGMLDWLWFNLERRESTDASERDLGESEVEATTAFLPAAATWIMTQSFNR